MEQQKYSANSFNQVAQLELMKMIAPTATKVLDLGCGDGQTTRILQELLPKAQIYGLTANSEEAEGNSDDTIQLIYGDAHQLPFEDRFFDVIYARHILEHCIAPFIAIGELNRVLCLGGQAIIAVPENNAWSDSYPDHYSVLSKSMWEKLFVQCGFTVKEFFRGSWFAWGAAAELPELRFTLEKTSDFVTGEKLIHVYTPKTGRKLVQPPKQVEKRPLGFFFHNIVTYESMRNVLFELKTNNIPFDIVVPLSTTDPNAKEMFEDTITCIRKEFPEVEFGDGTNKVRYKAAFLPFLPFFFPVESDYVVRYQYGIAKASYNFDIWSMSFDYILCQSPYDFKALRNYTQAKLVGNAKFLNTDRKKDHGGFSILYMPTYGELSSLDTRFDLIRELAKHHQIRIKLHHMTLYFEPERLEMIKEVFSDENIFTHKDYLSDLFQTTDLVISDTSGAIFDSIQWGIPLVLLKDDDQVIQKEQFSLEEQLVTERKIPYVTPSDSLVDMVEMIRNDYETHHSGIKQLRNQLFPVSGTDAISNYLTFIDELLKDQIDKTALRINRNKLSYMFELENTVEQQKHLLDKLEQSYSLQKIEIEKLLGEYKNRVEELSVQVVELWELNKGKDKRISELSDEVIKQQNEA